MTRLFFFLGVAGAVAIAVAVLTHNELGLSPMLIRKAALICSGLLGIGLYSDRLGRRK